MIYQIFGSKVNGLLVEKNLFGTSNSDFFILVPNNSYFNFIDDINSTNLSRTLQNIANNKWTKNNFSCDPKKQLQLSTFIIYWYFPFVNMIKIANSKFHLIMLILKIQFLLICVLIFSSLLTLFFLLFCTRAFILILLNSFLHIWHFKYSTVHFKLPIFCLNYMILFFFSHFFIIFSPQQDNIFSY